MIIDAIVKKFTELDKTRKKYLFFSEKDLRTYEMMKPFDGVEVSWHYALIFYICAFTYYRWWLENECIKIRRDILCSEERWCSKRSGEGCGFGSGAFDEAVGESGVDSVAENIGEKFIKN